jgi:hypothetical protein
MKLRSSPKRITAAAARSSEARTMRVTGRVEADAQINGEKLEASRK